MRRFLLITAAAILLSSCKFTGGKQILEKAGDALQALEPAAEQSQVLPVEWYEKDFSLVMVIHEAFDKTVRITRIGDKVYIRSQLAGVTMVSEVYEALPEGYRIRAYNKDGKLVTDKEYDYRSLGEALRYQLRKTYPVLSDLPKDTDFSNAQEGTCCGRPSLTVQSVEESTFPKGVRTVSTVCIDKEYRFIYRWKSHVTISELGINQETTPFEVTYFTDHPTNKDIANN